MNEVFVSMQMDTVCSNTPEGLAVSATEQTAAVHTRTK